jgi:glyoxylase-like metal-dependent hydrolase (beta-lactamase superfamily II)
VSHVEPLRLGDVEIAVMCQGWAPLNLADECPGHEVDWDRERAETPWAFSGMSQWQWHVHAFVVSTPSGVTMVDSGLGASPPYRPWASGEGIEASEAYAIAGVDTAAVSTVVLTHLHPDHSGGIAEGREPRFPNARYVLHEADWSFLHRDDLDGYSALARPGLRRVHELGMLDLDPDDRDVAARVEVLHAPGHTPGHRSVVVHAGDEAVLLTGDLLHLPLQAAHAEWLSGHDEDAEIGARSRVDLLARARTGRWRVGVPHLARPFGRVGDGWDEGAGGSSDAEPDGVETSG